MSVQLATVDRLSTSHRRRLLRAELATLDAATLATRLEGLAAELDDLHAGLVYGTRRLAALAAAASRTVDELLDIEGLMALTKRSRSWIEHNGRRVPGRCQSGGPGGRVRWRKREVLRWLAAGGC
jgi:predicted DNA-binding transcriptional regulator AlpA